MGADGYDMMEPERLRIREGLAEPRPDSARADEAANGFPDRFAGMSARSGLTGWQRQTARRIFSVLGIGALVAPGLVWAGLSLAGLALFCAILLYRFALVIYGRGREPEADYASASELLPVYTLLIALKDEAAVVPQLARHICRFDYPQHLLDVKLLIETGDEATRDAIRAQIWPKGTELLVLPPGMPRTKPRALNYGLSRARGAFVTVYDAEDRPSPIQLISAVRRFTHDPSLACVQAPLVGIPKTPTWLARHWALEYAIQFNRVMPALARLGAPIALGGTSNHFRRSALEEVGGWDAWNVTEDADLGLRFARQGKSVGVIAPPTLEAPPERFYIWLGQRSRWLKGFLQTWLVLMRNPGAAVREMGLGGFVSMQLTLGASILSAFTHLPWLIWCLLCIASPALNLGPVSWSILVATYGVGAVSACLVPRGVMRLRFVDVLTLPLYWPLQSVAMARAVYSLIRTPHHWVKTPHD
ncbi:glycosyltransferase family 2 protein [Hyphomonas pacifica]|nr:glycosyltransferase family 2 protein [Hyphomonas pacifica]KCZ53143.1 hypothetical protein HY2_01045 [Hyphomonas pacifica]